MSAAGTTTTPSSSATTTSPGRTATPAQTTGTLTEPSVDFTVPFSGMAPQPNREPHFFKSGNVPGASVNYQAAHTARLQRSREKLAEHSVGIVRRAGDDEHIAGATLLRRNVDHPVVAGLRQGCHNAPSNARTRPNRTNVCLHKIWCATRCFMGRRDT